jgi:hypothetical protein
MTDAEHRSQIDGWVFPAFATAALLALGACVPLLVYGGWTERFVSVPLLLAGIAFPGWVLVSTAYTLTSRALLIRSGPFRWSIPLREITEVTPTRSALSSPALSLDRLRIRYASNSIIMVSPEDRRRFLADLKARGVGIAR